MLPRFWKYYWKAKTKYNVHSPFLFDFVQEVLEDERQYYAFSDLELLRERLKSDDRLIEVIDLGAGSHRLAQHQRKISAIAKTSLTGPFFCQLLFKLIAWRAPKTMLEMGTSLGLSASYFHRARSAAQLITLEGSPAIAQVAQGIFAENEYPIDLRLGPFDQTLETAIADLKPLDFVFIDGNHQEKSTLAYWEKLQQHLTKDAIVIFDDIHWSAGMENAWRTIIKTPGIRHSIDLFSMGVVHWQPNDQTAAEHISLIPSKFKWWNWGIFG